MTNVLIQLDARISDDVAGAFPHLTARHDRDSTTLIGKVADQREMLGVMDLLVAMGVEVVALVRLPEF